MYNRGSMLTWRLIQSSLGVSSKQLYNTSVLFVGKYSTIPVTHNRNNFNELNWKLSSYKIMGQEYSTDANQINIPVVSYEVIKNLPNHPENMLIDVRELDEIKETGMIPTAIHIPLGEIKTALEMSDRQFKTKYNRNKPDVTDELIFHCKIGKRSEYAAITATKLGYKNAKNYLGSWTDWAEREGLSK